MEQLVKLCEDGTTDLSALDVTYGNPISGGRKRKDAISNLEIDGDEELYLIYDDAIFGSRKKGFALTTSGIHPGRRHRQRHG